MRERGVILSSVGGRIREGVTSDGIAEVEMAQSPHQMARKLGQGAFRRDKLAAQGCGMVMRGN
jgi:hypothetical protein